MTSSRVQSGLRTGPRDGQLMSRELLQRDRVPAGARPIPICFRWCHWSSRFYLLLTLLWICRRVRRCCAPRADAGGVTAPLGRMNTPLMVRGFGGKGQTGGRGVRAGRIAKDTLLFGRLGLANIGQETRMGSAALGVVGSRLFEAELAVDGEANFRGIAVFLAVVLPPADGAKRSGASGCSEFVYPQQGQREAGFDGGTHPGDGRKEKVGITARRVSFYADVVGSANLNHCARDGRLRRSMRQTGRAPARGCLESSRAGLVPAYRKLRPAVGCIEQGAVGRGCSRAGRFRG